MMKSTWFNENVIARISPRWAFRRDIARAQRHLLFSTYQGAETSRRTKDWKASTKSADGEIIPDAMTMNARVRQLVRDNAYARSITRSLSRNIVGCGITPMASVRRANEKPNDKFNKAADIAFHRYSRDPMRIDTEGKKTFHEMQTMLIETIATVGEAFVLRTMVGNQVAFTVVEPEQLDLTKTQHEGREVRGGIEVNANGRAVAYHFYDRTQTDDHQYYPTPLRAESTRYPADRVKHLFVQHRPGQTRGVTWFAPVMNRLWDLVRYDDAQLMAARLEACIGLVLKTEGGPAQIGLDGATGSTGTDARGNSKVRFEPGMVARLNPGEEATTFAPSRPGDLYDPFIKTQLRAIAAGVGLSYEQVARDFTNGNFSSQRQALLEDRREWSVAQAMLIDHFCQWVYDEFIKNAVLRGEIEQVGFYNNVDGYCECEWMPDGWDWIDPAKEMAGIKLAIEQRMTTRKAELNLRGKNFNEVASQIADEKAVYAGKGIDLPEDVATTPATDPSEPRPTSEGRAGTGGGRQSQQDE